MKAKRTAVFVALFAIFGLFFTSSHFSHRHPAPAVSMSSTLAPESGGGAPPRQPASEFAPFCENMYKAICQKTGETRDPTGTMSPDVDGELLALRTFEDIIRSHPDWSSEQVDEELANEIYTAKRRSRVEAAFHWVRKMMLRFIESQPETVFNHREKEQLKHRLAKVELQLPPPASVYADEPDLFTKDDIYYERTTDGKMQMRFGGAYFLSAKSWFNLVFTIGHELAHSIDPCELRASHISLPAYDRLTACFMTRGLVAMRKTRDECGADDQLSETFADWLAVQMTQEALASFSTEFKGPQLLNATTNAVRDLCEQDQEADPVDTELHAPPAVRIQKIFGDSPGIRNLLGCTQVKEKEYCDFNSVSGT